LFRHIFRLAGEYSRCHACLVTIIVEFLRGDSYNQEIAASLGCVVRTVERKLEVIRSLWGAEAGP
jgi:ECF sigma factor